MYKVFITRRISSRKRRINKTNFITPFKKLRWAPAFYLVIAVIDTLTKGADYNIYIHRTGIIFGVIAVVNLVAWLLENNKIKVNATLAGIIRGTLEKDGPIATLYGRQEVVERSLDFIVDQTPLPGWMNGMPAYSMWWIIILTDYARKTGANEYLKGRIPYMKALVAQMNEFVDDAGNMTYPGFFVDWPTHDQPDEPAGMRAINIMAAKRAVSVFKQFGENEGAADAEKLLAKLEKVEMNVESAKQVIALKYFATGKLSGIEAAKLVEGGAKGFSTFMSYFILTAIAKYYGAEAALKLMKDYYGAMLDRGATTFFEDFHMEWLEGSGRIDELTPEGVKDIHGDYGAYCYIGYRHSLCHGWSAGVITFIEENT